MKTRETRLAIIEKRAQEIREGEETPRIPNLAELYERIAEEGLGFMMNPSRNNERFQG